jgi:hypothetical protein
VRTTLDISDDVLRAARAVAKAEKISLGQAVSKLARQGLAPRAAARRGGFPVFDVGRDADPITPDMVREADDAP